MASIDLLDNHILASKTGCIARRPPSTVISTFDQDRLLPQPQTTKLFDLQSSNDMSFYFDLRIQSHRLRWVEVLKEFRPMWALCVIDKSIDPPNQSSATGASERPIVEQTIRR